MLTEWMALAARHSLVKVMVVCTTAPHGLFWIHEHEHSVIKERTGALIGGSVNRDSHDGFTANKCDCSNERRIIHISSWQFNKSGLFVSYSKQLTQQTSTVIQCKQQDQDEQIVIYLFTYLFMCLFIKTCKWQVNSRKCSRGNGTVSTSYKIIETNV